MIYAGENRVVLVRFVEDFRGMFAEPPYEIPLPSSSEVAAMGFVEIRELLTDLLRVCNEKVSAFDSVIEKIADILNETALDLLCPNCGNGHVAARWKSELGSATRLLQGWICSNERCSVSWTIDGDVDRASYYTELI